MRDTYDHSTPSGDDGAAGGPADRLPAGRGGDWLGTLGQEMLRVPLLLRHMRATWEVGGVQALDPAELVARGIRGVVWDVDGTLMRRGDSSVASHLQAALERVLGEPRLRHAIVSNCGEARFIALSRIFPAVPLLRVYPAPAGGLIRRRRLGEVESWTPVRPQAEDLQGVRALRKPSPELMRFALEELGVPAAAAAVVGDQRLTDVACANLAGLRSIKVPTLGRESFPLAVRFMQRAEEAAYRVLYRSPRTTGWEVR